MLTATIVGLVFAAAAWGVVAFVERLRDRTRQRAVYGALGEPNRQRGATGLVATLEGHLADDAPVITSFHPSGTSFLEEPNAYALTHGDAERALVLNLGEGHHAKIEGDIQVLVGSIESEHGASIDAAGAFDAAPLVGRIAARKRRGQFRRVAAGDLVRVRGAIEPAPDDDALYREGSSVVRVRPAPGAVVNVVAIASTRAAARRRTRASRAAWLASVSAFVIGGGGALTIARAPVPVTTSAVDATPASCRSTVLERLAKDDLAGASAARAKCDDAYAQAMEAFTRGAFSEASELFGKASNVEPQPPPSLTETEAHLFAHQHRRAAASSKRMVERFYPGPSTAEKRYLECIAGLVEDLTRPPRPKPSDPRQPLHPTACADHTFSKFAHSIDSTNHFGIGPEGAGGAYTAVGNPFSALVGTRARLFARPVGVERDLLDRFVLADGPPKPLPENPWAECKECGVQGYGRIGYFWWADAGEVYVRMSAIAAELVLFYGYAGVPERAAPYFPILDRVVASRESRPKRSFHERIPDAAWASQDDEWIAEEDALIRYVMSIAAAGAFLAKDEARVKRYLPHAEVHSAAVQKQLARMLEGAPWEEPKEDGHWGDRKALFDAAAGGDGAKVARMLTAQRTTGAEALPRIVPRLRTNRAALDAWFAKEFPASCLTCGASSYLGHLIDRRAVARLLGANDEVERLSPIIARFVDAQTDTKIAWELDELETFFARPR